MHQNGKLNGGGGGEPPFVRGMTLEDYMASVSVEPQREEKQEELFQENLLESSHFGIGEGVSNKRRHYRIDQIDQESIEDSKDYHKGLQERETPSFEPMAGQQTITESEQARANPKTRANSISLSTAVTFKLNQENSHFRIKRMSVSPHHKISSPSSNASITHYGAKFSGPPSKNKHKMPEMLTFYGKLTQLPQEPLVRKSSIKESDLKQKFKRKQGFELHRVLQFEEPRLPTHRQQYPNLRVEGHREGWAPRKHPLL